ALKDVRSVRVHSQTTRRSAHGRRIKPCGFNKNILGGIRNGGVKPAHDSGQSDRTDRIGDDQVFRIKLAVNSIQCLECLTWASATDDDLSALELVEIESMGGMAQFHQGVIAGVHGVAYAAVIVDFEAFEDRGRRGPNLYVAHDTRGIALAAIGVFDFDRNWFR